MEPTLNRNNVDAVLQDYLCSVYGVGCVISGLSGVKLFHFLKREKIGAAPYRGVTL